MGERAAGRCARTRTSGSTRSSPSTTRRSGPASAACAARRYPERRRRRPRVPPPGRGDDAEERRGRAALRRRQVGDLPTRAGADRAGADAPLRRVRGPHGRRLPPGRRHGHLRRTTWPTMAEAGGRRLLRRARPVARHRPGVARRDPRRGRPRRRHAGPRTGATVLVQGAGHVGAALARQLAADGARVLVADVDPARAAAVAGRDRRRRRWTPTPRSTRPCDVLAPCAVARVITPETVAGARAAGSSRRGQRHARRRRLRRPARRPRHHSTSPTSSPTPAASIDIHALPREGWSDDARSPRSWSRIGDARRARSWPTRRNGGTTPLAGGRGRAAPPRPWPRPAALAAA